MTRDDYDPTEGSGALLWGFACLVVVATAVAVVIIVRGCTAPEVPAAAPVPAVAP